MNRHLKTLELDKILNILAAEASFAESKELALSLRPQNDMQRVLANLKETEDAYILTGRFGAPSFGSIKNISGCLARAAAGGMLSMGELLRIAEVLRIVRGVRQWREKCASVESVLDRRFQSLVPNKYLEDSITSAIIS